MTELVEYGWLRSVELWVLVPMWEVGASADHESNAMLAGGQKPKREWSYHLPVPPP